MSDAPKPGSPGDGAARPDEAPDEFLAEPPAPESRWLLLALSRHVERQRWVARVGAERLGADLAQIGREGAFGHPERQRGAVPGLPEWTFCFHGVGLCLTREDGLEIDVDFIGGRDDAVDPYFFQRYLETEPEPGLPERRLRRPAPYQGTWMCDLQALEERGWIALERGARLTPEGEAEAGRLAAAAAAIEDAQTPGEAMQLAARFGDLELALEVMPPGPARALLEQRRAEQRRERRDWLLTLELDSLVVSALGALGRELSQEAVLGALRLTPPTGATSAALEVATAWGDPGLAPEVLALLQRAAGRAPPAPYLRARSARLLLRWYGPQDLPPQTRATLLEVLGRDAGASEGEVGLALALLDRPRGLERLALAADSEIPHARQTGSCALALLGLLGVAEAGPLLSAARSDEARAALAVLEDRPLPMAPEPVGERRRIAGRIRRIFSFEELRRAQVPGAVLRGIEALLRDYRDILQRWL
jgi:hypothetical protein